MLTIPPCCRPQVLCASNDDHDKVVPVAAPAGAVPGDRVTVAGFENAPLEEVRGQQQKNGSFAGLFRLLFFASCPPSRAVGGGGGLEGRQGEKGHGQVASRAFPLSGRHRSRRDGLRIHPCLKLPDSAVQCLQLAALHYPAAAGRVGAAGGVCFAGFRGAPCVGGSAVAAHAPTNGPFPCPQLTDLPVFPFTLLLQVNPKKKILERLFPDMKTDAGE